MNINSAKKIAAGLLKVGTTRIWIDTNSVDQVLEAATRDDIRALIMRNVIQKVPAKGNSGARFRKRIVQRSKERRHGPGSVRGTRNARDPRKRRWIRTIRAVRDELRTLKQDNRINKSTYRKYYRMSKGGKIRSRAQLVSQITASGSMGEKK
ncbi:MAG: 50S ribosomal protein L19e [Thermoplasmataceae archaeon]